MTMWQSLQPPPQAPLQPPKPKYKPVHVLETARMAEIRDALDNLRYQVVLAGHDVIDDLNGFSPAKAYQIQVNNCFYGEAPLVVVTVPNEGEPPLTDYAKAVKTYEAYVKLYTSLVKAETKDIQDMDIYAEKVGYHVTCPACCATCRWSEMHKPGHVKSFGAAGRLECHNPKNVNEFDFDIDSKERCASDEKHLFPSLSPKHRPIPLFPFVKPLGCCDQYEKAKEKPHPCPTDSIAHAIDCDVAARLDIKMENVIIPAIKKEVEEQISAYISADIG